MSEEKEASVLEQEEQTAVEGQDPEENAEGQNDSIETDGGEEVVVKIGGEENQPSPEEEEQRKAPQWVKDLRKQNRELQSEIHRLKNKPEQPKEELETLGKKPEFEDDECKCDPEIFEKKLAEYYERARKIEERKSEKEKGQKEAIAKWEERLAWYETEKVKFAKAAPDYEDVEAEVLEKMNNIQKGLVVALCDKPEAMIYGIGKNKKLFDEITSEKDPAKFAYILGRKEGTMTIETKKRQAPPPESRIEGSARGGTSDAMLAKLEAEADRTGDRSKIVAYKRQLRSKQT